MSAPTELEKEVATLRDRMRRLEWRLAQAEDKLTLVRIYRPGRPWWQWRLALTEEQWRTAGLVAISVAMLIEPIIRKRHE